jgi:hypothetical protein
MDGVTYVLAVTFFAMVNGANVPVIHDRSTIGTYSECQALRAVKVKAWNKDNRQYAVTCRAWRPGDPPLSASVIQPAAARWL